MRIVFPVLTNLTTLQLGITVFLPSLSTYVLCSLLLDRFIRYFLSDYKLRYLLQCSRFSIAFSVLPELLSFCVFYQTLLIC